MVEEKNNVAFHISEQLKSFQSLQEKQKILLNFGFSDSRSISAAQGSEEETQWRNQILQTDVYLHTVTKSSSHMDKEQDKRR